MPNEQVGKALREAARTWTCHCHPSEPCADCMRYASVAVAAFLRALPTLHALPVSEGHRDVIGINRTRLRALAAAVEAQSVEGE